MGSSMVMMWQARVWLMWSIIAASVVVLPEPVGPVTSTRPRCSSPAGAPRRAGRRSSSVEALVRTRRMARATDERW